MSQPKIPNIKLPSKLLGQQPSGQPQAGMNPDSFNELIKSKGIRMVHSRPVPCPRRLSIHDGDHDPGCTDCHNGFIYYGERAFIGAFQGNSNQRQFVMNGSYDIDQATIVLPSTYDDGTELDVQFFDQILVPDYTVRYYQLVEHSQTGIDKLHFPAKSIDFIMDAYGVQYRVGVDVIINEKGYLEWVGERPGYDPVTGNGIIYSVNYYTRPVFTVIGLPHQIRATQTLDKDGNSIQQRFPQLAVVRKDFIPHDPYDKVGPSDRPEPKDGSV
jgi:hypothetical protein